MNRFDDRRIIVTGGGSGIGQGTVKRLLAEGGTVHAIDVNAAGLDTTLAAAQADGNADRLTVGTLDISNEAAVSAHVGEVIERLGGLEVLVNAAGIMRVTHTLECSLDVWNQVINVNLTGTFLMTRAALPALLATGRGVVVNFSSTSANFAHPYMAAYAASKGGVDSFTHTIAVEYAKQGLRAVAVAPGGIVSGITDDAAHMIPKDADWSLFAKMSAMISGGMGEPADVASVIAMLASDDGKWITATAVRIDGGAHG
ncbi:MAG: short-chain dehydrogenase [Ilumatobacteraceae bacterium]|nr:short-chain dehydrogenase [Ilumatobacteraceae bacterium]